jgi:hypothetical protein
MFYETVLRHAPWSISKIGMLEKCGKQYNHKYIEKHKEGPKSDESREGVTGHAILEKGLQMPPGTPLLQLAHEEIEQRGLTTKEAESILAEIDWMEDYRSRVEAFKKEQGVVESYEEKKLAIKRDFTRTDFFDKEGLLRGVLDQGLITRANVMVCIDHKFGKRKSIREHEVQFNAYRLMIVANWNVAGVQ